MNKTYIVRNPNIMGGLPTVSGTRLPVSRVVYLMKEGYTLGTISQETQVEEKILGKAVDELINTLSTKSKKYDETFRQVQTAS